MKNYYRTIQARMREFLLWENYRQMPLALAILSGIVMAPVILIVFVLFGILSVIYFFFYLFSLPANFLLEFIKGEGREVKHATQAVIYFIGFPFIFLWYVYMAVAIVFVYIGYILYSVALYYASLGSVALRLDLVKESEKESSITPLKVIDKKKYFKSALAFVIVSYCLPLLTITTFVARYIISFNTGYLNMVPVYIAMIICRSLTLLFILIYVPLAFRKKD